MKLTVGPLPPAVYWRRRAIVLGVCVGVVVLLLAYACSGGSKASDKGNKAAASQSATPTGTGGTPGPSTGPSATPPPTTVPSGTPAAAPPQGGTAVTACGDGDLQLVPSLSAPSIPAGGSVMVKLKIRNVSNRTCSRDVGPGPQELRVLQNGSLIWSSDHCNLRQDSDVRSYPPSGESEFGPVRWDANRSAAGCPTPLATADKGDYEFIWRVGSKESTPVPIKVT